jgi:hypothetical protein
VEGQNVPHGPFAHERVEEGKFGGAGIAEHEAHPFLAEELEKRRFTGHHGHGLRSYGKDGRGSSAGTDPATFEREALERGIRFTILKNGERLTLGGKAPDSHAG